MDSGQKSFNVTWVTKNRATRVVGMLIGLILALMYLSQIESVLVAIGITLFTAFLMWLESQSVGKDGESRGPWAVAFATMTGAYLGILLVIWLAVIF
jgi:hypothetical protein